MKRKGEKRDDIVGKEKKRQYEWKERHRMSGKKQEAKEVEKKEEKEEREGMTV